MKAIKITRVISFFSILGLVFCSFTLPSFKVEFHKKLRTYCKTLPLEFNQIAEDRKKDLQEIGDFIVEKRVAGKMAAIEFICTSNSRRSHMGQVWAQTAAAYYEVDSLWTFSGGTEATRVNKNAIAAFARCGFEISGNNVGDNPLWFVRASNTKSSWVIWSKKYTDSTNPKKDFCAVMVCSEADKSCPSVDGAELRIAMPYDDPKYFDGTPSQDAKYDERCRQIARDMFFMMDYVKKKLMLTIK
jgi:arsenate reductase (thioredoxin)